MTVQSPQSTTLKDNLQSVSTEINKQSSLMGRPTKKTIDLVTKLTDAFHDDATIEQACYYSGITKTTYYRWLEEDEDFKYEMAKAQEYPKVLAKRVLIKAMENGDEKTALEVIKRLEKDRYSDRHENTGKDGERLIPIMGGTALVSED